MSDAPMDESKRTSKSKKSRKKKKKKSKERSLEELPPPLLQQEVNGDEDDEVPKDDDPANRPCPYRRNYRCKLCEFLTLHPREFLAHLRDCHHQKLTIHQCPKCEYASRHQQKLKRHIGLTHNRGKDTRTPPKNPRRSKLAPPTLTHAYTSTPGPSAAVSSFAQESPGKKGHLRVKLGGKRSEPSGGADGKDGGHHARKRMRKTERAQVLTPTDAAAEAAEALLAVAARAANFEQMDPPVASMSPKEKGAEDELHSCSVCSFQSHSKVTVARHERMVHLRKKFFRCARCAYVTHIRSRYTKHLRYHNLPYIKCDFCDFTTPYKWNLDRHLRNHEPGAGDFACVMCGFATHSKQSLTVHVANHHLSAQQFAHKMLDKPKPRRRGHSSLAEGEMDQPSMEEGHIVDDDEDDAVEVEVDENGGLRDDQMAVEMDEYSKLGSVSEIPPDDDQCQDDVVFVKDGRICRPPKNVPLPSQPPPPLPTNQSQQQRCVLCNKTFDDRQLLTSHLKMIHRVPASILLHSFTNIETALFALDNSADNSSVPSSPPPQTRKSATHGSHTSHNSKGSDGGLQTTRSHRVVRPPKIFVPEGDENNSSTGNNGECHGEDDGKKSLLRCDLCPYEAKWISELVKHRRVHTQEKPFACPHCEFRSRWKGDLTRHIHKYHLANDGSMPEDAEGMSSSSSKGAPTPAEGIETLMAQSMQVGSEDELVVLEDGRTIAMSTDVAVRRPDTVTKKVSAAMPGQHHLLRHQEDEEELEEENEEEEEEEEHDHDFPLDLSRRVPVTRSIDDMDMERMESHKRVKRRKLCSNFTDKECILDELAAVALQMVDDGEDDLDNLDRLLALPSSKRTSIDGSPEQPQSSPGRTQRIRTRYQCPRCGFSARTASRFHVHIIGHLNKKPFMCSECGYRSNWEWDVNKHIRLKSSKGESHNTATLVPVDECGQRNYEKYDKFLVYEVVDKDLPTSSGAASAEEDADAHEVKAEEEEDEEDEIDDEFRETNIAEPAPLITSNKRRRTSWKCKYCNFKHTLKRAIVRHAVVHSENKRYWCGLCGQASNWHHCMLRHCRSRHGADGPIYEHMQSAADSAAAAVPAYAEFCPEEPLDNEQDAASGNKHHCCNICPYRTRKQFDLKMHYFLHQPRDGAVFKCQYCPFYVSAKRSLMPHMRLHTQNETQENNECIDDYEDNIQDEELAVEEEEEEEEDEEQEEDAVESYTDREMAVAEEPDVEDSTESSIPLVWASRGGAFQKMFKCRYCPHVNKKKWTIVEHEKLHQKQEMVGKFACNKCNYKCNNQGVLTAHLKVHRNVVQVHAYVAEEETEATVAAANTTEPPRHMVAATSRSINTGKTYHRCPQCPARFSKLRVWEVHQTFHGASLPWKCEQCSYAARHRPHLHKHQLVHSDEYAMKFMPGGFPRRSAVVVQPGTDEYPKYDETVPMRSIVYNPVAKVPVDTVKTLIKRHQCHKCPAVFLKPANLVSHLKLHGAKGRYRCPQCEYTVQNVGNLVRHAKLHDAPEQKSEAVERMKTIPEPVPTSSKYQAPGGFFPAETTRRMARLVCPKCPAAFEKRSRFQVHIRLHGSDQRYQCATCDYSVNCRANLYKHERVHHQEDIKNAPEPETEQEPEAEMPYDLSCHYPQAAVCSPDVPSATMPISIPSTSSGTIAAAERHQHQLIRNLVQEAAAALHAKSACNLALGLDSKKIFQCGRCPYTNRRKDAVQSHIKRHVGNSQENTCPHCDYGSALHSFLKDHVKLHFRPLTYRKRVDGYLACDDYEVWCDGPDGTMMLIFRSQDGAGGTDAFIFPQSYQSALDSVTKQAHLSDKDDSDHRDESSDASVDSDDGDFMEVIRRDQIADGVEDVSSLDPADESSPVSDRVTSVQVTEDNVSQDNVEESMAIDGSDSVEARSEDKTMQFDKLSGVCPLDGVELPEAHENKDSVEIMEESSESSESEEESTIDSTEDRCDSDVAVKDTVVKKDASDDVRNDFMLDDAKDDSCVEDARNVSTTDDTSKDSTPDNVRKESALEDIKNEPILSDTTKDSSGDDDTKPLPNNSPCNDILNLKPELNNADKSPQMEEDGEHVLEKPKDNPLQLDIVECSVSTRTEVQQSINNCTTIIDETLRFGYESSIQVIDDSMTKKECNMHQTDKEMFEIHDRSADTEDKSLIKEIEIIATKTEGDLELVDNVKTEEDIPVNDEEDVSRVTGVVDTQCPEEKVCLEDVVIYSTEDGNSTIIKDLEETNQVEIIRESLPMDIESSSQEVEGNQNVSEDVTGTSYELNDSSQNNDGSCLNTVVDDNSQKDMDITNELDVKPTELLTVNTEVILPKQDVPNSETEIDTAEPPKTPEQDHQCNDDDYLTVEEAVARLFADDERHTEMKAPEEVTTEFTDQDESVFENVAVEVEVDENVQECEEDSYANAIVLLEESDLGNREHKP